MVNWTIESRAFTIKQNMSKIDSIWQWGLKCPGCSTVTLYYTSFIALPSGTTTVAVYCTTCDETHPCAFTAPT